MCSMRKYWIRRWKHYKASSATKLKTKCIRRLHEGIVVLTTVVGETMTDSRCTVVNLKTITLKNDQQEMKATTMVSHMTARSLALILIHQIMSALFLMRSLPISYHTGLHDNTSSCLECQKGHWPWQIIWCCLKFGFTRHGSCIINITR